MKHQLFYCHIGCAFSLRKVSDLAGNVISAHFPERMAVYVDTAPADRDYAEGRFSQGAFATSIHANDTCQFSLFKYYRHII